MLTYYVCMYVMLCVTGLCSCWFPLCHYISNNMNFNHTVIFVLLTLSAVDLCPTLVGNLKLYTLKDTIGPFLKLKVEAFS